MPTLDDGGIPSLAKPRVSRIVLILAIMVPVAILVWLIMPRHARVREAVPKIVSSNNLAQIGRAMHTYDEALERLPARAICDKDGKPLLSWRVSILPFIEYAHLYAQFKLDEPWDSPHNFALIEKMPKIYYHPKSTVNQTKGLTHYKVLAGKNTLFDQPVLVNNEWLNRWSLVKLQKAPRGTSDLILCLEAGDPVIWTKPEDFECDPDKPLPELKPLWPGNFMAVMADGQVIWV